MLEHCYLLPSPFIVVPGPMRPLKPKMSKKYAGRLGGLKGGHARAQSLSSEKRREIAKKAAEARWSGKQKDR